MGNRDMTTIRLPKELLAWLRTYSANNNIPFTRVIEDLLVALREGRLVMRPRPDPNPFPRENVEVGSTPDYPVLVAAGLKR